MNGRIGVVLASLTLAVVALLAPSPVAAEGELEPPTATQIETIRGIAYLQYDGIFEGETSTGAYRVPYRITAPAHPRRGNRTVLIERLISPSGSGRSTSISVGTSSSRADSRMPASAGAQPRSATARIFASSTPRRPACSSTGVSLTTVGVPTTRSSLTSPVRSRSMTPPSRCSAPCIGGTWPASRILRRLSSAWSRRGVPRMCSISR